MSDNTVITAADERRRLLGELELERNQFIRNIETCRIRDIDRPFSGEWSLRDIVGHVATWEAEALAALRELKAGRRPKLLDFDPAQIDAFNQDHVERKREINFWNLFEQLKGTRARLLEEVEEIDDETLAAEGSVHGELLRALANHDRHHWRDIAARLAGMPGARSEDADSVPAALLASLAQPRTA